jgi:hypothetical protein
MLILGFDPGETTGWATVDTETGMYEGGSFEGWSKVFLHILEAHPPVVVVESFRLYDWSAKSLSWSMLMPVEVIGVIKYVCTWDQREVVMQTAAQAKIIKFRRKMGNFNDHTYDALRHVIAYMRSRKIVPESISKLYTVKGYKRADNELPSAGPKRP